MPSGIWSAIESNAILMHLYIYIMYSPSILCSRGPQHWWKGAFCNFFLLLSRNELNVTYQCVWKTDSTRLFFFLFIMEFQLFRNYKLISTERYIFTHNYIYLTWWWKDASREANKERTNIQQTTRNSGIFYQVVDTRRKTIKTDQEGWTNGEGRTGREKRDRTGHLYTS